MNAPPADDWKLEGCRRDSARIGSDWIPLRPPLIDGVSWRETRPVLSHYGALVELYRREWAGEDDRVDQIFASTLRRGAISAWHAHEHTLDRISVVQGSVRLVLFDGRRQASSHGQINEFLISPLRPGLLTIPPKVWHGAQNVGDGDVVLVNAVDRAYVYAEPDHWRLPDESSEIPFRFSR